VKTYLRTFRATSTRKKLRNFIIGCWQRDRLCRWKTLSKCLKEKTNWKVSYYKLLICFSLTTYELDEEKHYAAKITGTDFEHIGVHFPAVRRINKKLLAAKRSWHLQRLWSTSFQTSSRCYIALRPKPYSTNLTEWEWDAFRGETWSRNKKYSVRTQLSKRKDC